MATTRLVVCDECGNQRRTTASYRIMVGGDAVQLELCREHAAPLVHLMKLGTPVHRPVSTRARVWSMEEIEALRAKQARKQ